MKLLACSHPCPGPAAGCGGPGDRALPSPSRFPSECPTSSPSQPRARSEAELRGVDTGPGGMRAASTPGTPPQGQAPGVGRGQPVGSRLQSGPGARRVARGRGRGHPLTGGRF